jgi:hypothetical protein
MATRRINQSLKQNPLRRVVLPYNDAHLHAEEPSSILRPALLATFDALFNRGEPFHLKCPFHNRNCTILLFVVL